MIPTQTVDYLEQDPEIRNQKFVCMSFISPEEVLQKKDSFYFKKYTEEYTKKNKELYDGLVVMFPDKTDELRAIQEQYEQLFNASKINEDFKYFVKEKSTVLDQEFNNENNFQTSIRGIKIRGVYEDINEAQARCETLKRMDDNKFSIYIGQVGCWCPWSPNPDDVSNPVYAETQLNTLMDEYNKNIDKKDEYYRFRKNDLKERIQENEDRKKHASNDNDSVNVEEVIESFEKKDTWETKDDIVTN